MSDHQLICDSCRKPFGWASEYGGIGQLRWAAMKAGWVNVGDGRDLCPDCGGSGRAPASEGETPR